MSQNKDYGRQLNTDARLCFTAYLENRKGQGQSPLAVALGKRRLPPMHMESRSVCTLPGGLARSKARLERLRVKLGAKSVCALYVHFLDLLQPLDARTRTVLDGLLPFPGTFEDAFEEVNGSQPAVEEGETGERWQNIIETVSRGEPKVVDGVYYYFMAPRPGTISPWSSQATAQAHVCGLEGIVKRIERGTVFAISFADAGQGWNGEGTPPGWALDLYDRMTQSLGSQFPDLDALFGERKPRSALSIEIHLPDGSVSKEALQNFNRDAGLALDGSEIDYLVDAYGKLGRDPTNVELFMFAQGEYNVPREPESVTFPATSSHAREMMSNHAGPAHLIASLDLSSHCFSLITVHQSTPNTADTNNSTQIGRLMECARIRACSR